MKSDEKGSQVYNSLNYKCKICSYQRREPTLDQKEQANKDTKDGWPILIRKNNWWCGIDVDGVWRHSDNYPVTEAARFFWDQVMGYINSIKNYNNTQIDKTEREE